MEESTGHHIKTTEDSSGVKLVGRMAKHTEEETRLEDAKSASPGGNLDSTSTGFPALPVWQVRDSSPMPEHV